MIEDLSKIFRVEIVSIPSSSLRAALLQGPLTSATLTILALGTHSHCIVLAVVAVCSPPSLSLCLSLSPGIYSSIFISTSCFSLPLFLRHHSHASKPLKLAPEQRIVSFWCMSAYVHCIAVESLSCCIGSPAMKCATYCSLHVPPRRFHPSEIGPFCSLSARQVCLS